ncbi:hypothetical protein L6452_11562 [Arctium lappa]|uniref:Uncharacterized protein n=1 Tax=Arctium lappa TaxID=4217 RepID=A0ACB9DPR7_ARCLA|nr:hypothetical protein L6452_11562 [Arctium lappa]
MEKSISDWGVRKEGEGGVHWKNGEGYAGRGRGVTSMKSTLEGGGLRGRRKMYAGGGRFTWEENSSKEEKKSKNETKKYHHKTQNPTPVNLSHASFISNSHSHRARVKL